MYYLDEDINITVNIPEGVVVQDSIATYQLKEGNDLLFTGSCFLPNGCTSKTIRVNELIEDHKWKNNLIADTDFSLVTGLVSAYSVTIWAGRSFRTDFEVASIYRYPHLNTPGMTLNTAPDRFQMMVDGYNHTTQKYKLTPHIPYVTSGEFMFPLVLESNSSNQIRPYIMDGTNSTPTLQTTCKIGYNKGNFTLYQLLGSVQLDKDADLYLSEELNETLTNFAYVAHIDYCPAKFYLVWQDRYGGTQSQPFDGNSTYRESFNRFETTDYTNRRHISKVDVQPKFTLNSKWLDFNKLPYYESLFVSPWLRLYERETGYTYDVIVTDTEYNEMTFQTNGRQMFNYTLNLETTKQQNILW